MTTLINGVPRRVYALIEEYRGYIGKIDDAHLSAIRKPECGKPGKGYKAQRKAIRERNAYIVHQAALWSEIEHYIRPSSKTSFADANKRRDRVMALVRMRGAE